MLDLELGTPAAAAAAAAAAKVGGGRLKGKERKKAKEAAAKSSSAAAPSGPQYIIQVSQFVPMAKAIASYKPKLNVPPALSYLEGPRPLEEARKTSKLSPKTVDEKLPTKINVQVQRDEDDIERDFFLAIYIFLKELNEARAFIKSTWKDVATDPFRIPHAALQSNLGIQMVRRAEMSPENFLERPERFPASTFPTWTFPFIFLFKIVGFLEPAAVAKLPARGRLGQHYKPGLRN
ncbi:hypothetical protein PG994_012523 [Apiospora phragmitis]|uniref:DUF6604 domain-containing protein n=1 Tax=Apiospora phragmitis TaxID=2905665 RepID=A0ABR1TYK9_9PEZI